MEQILEGMYLAWEYEIQSIRNNNDVARFQRTFNTTQNFFETEFNKKNQCLTAYKAQNYKELTENYERLKNLQNQYFESSATKQLAIEQQKKTKFY